MRSLFLFRKNFNRILYNLLYGICMCSNFARVTNLFANWAKLKLKMHLSYNTNYVYFKERQLWWVSLGQNIGSERNGKHKNFERPVLILKKFNAEMFLAIPTSSQLKLGRYRYTFQKDFVSYEANLSQMRVLSSKRLLRLIGKLNKEDYKNIKEMYKKLL